MTMQALENFATILKIALTFASGGIIFASLAGYWGKVWWAFDLFSHFRVHYLILAFLFAAGLFLVGSHRFAAVLMAVGLFNLILIAPYFIPQARAGLQGNAYRLLSANVLTWNLHHQLVRDLIIEEQPDFIVLAEVNQPWLDDLDLAELGYLYSEEYPRDNNFGVAFFSRIPFEEAQIVDTIVPSVLVRYSLEGRSFSIVGTHTWPPLNGYLSNNRDQQMIELAELVNKQSGAVIFCGDLNLTSWSHAYSEFVRGTGMRDSRLGRGIQASWPVNKPLLKIPIDHVLVTDEIDILERRLGPDIGSDHFPVITDFHLNDR